MLVTWTSGEGATYSSFTGQDSAFSQIFRWPDDIDLFFHRPQGGMAGTTVFVVTHDRDMVDKMRRRVIALDDGRMVRDQAAGMYADEESTREFAARMRDEMGVDE